MKKILIIAIVLCSMLTFAGSSQAYMVGTTDVGGLDTLKAQTTLSNSDPNPGSPEYLWLQGQISGDISIFRDNDMSGWTLVNSSDSVYAFHLTDDPDYFLLKLGKGNNEFADILFTNNIEKSWAVVDLTGTGYSIKNVASISHIDEINGGTPPPPPPPVPEPGMLLLFGTGLVGLGFFGRRKTGK